MVLGSLVFLAAVFVIACAVLCGLYFVCRDHPIYEKGPGGGGAPFVSKENTSEGRVFILAALHPPRRETLTKCRGQMYGSEARLRRRGPAL